MPSSVPGPIASPSIEHSMRCARCGAWRKWKWTSRRTACRSRWIRTGRSSPPRSRKRHESSPTAHGLFFYCTTSRDTRTRTSHASSGLPLAHRSPNCSRHARSFAGCSRTWSITCRLRVEPMSHLHPERLAALADGEPTAAEATHLSSCSVCAREIAAHRRLLMLAWQERETLTAPLASWESIVAGARQEGLIRAAGYAHDTRSAERVTAARSPWWLQAAAAVVLL